MFVIGIGWDPLVFTWGNLQVSWHGVFTALGVVLGVLVPARLAPRLGQTAEQVYSIALWAVPGGMVGSRLTHVIDNWGYYTAYPLQALRFWEGGTGLYGALLGGAVTGIAYAYFRKLPVARFCDLAAPGMILAQVTGRIGCLINGDAYGTFTSLPWALVYTHPAAGVTTRLYEARHPAVIYEMLWDLVVLALLWRFFGKLKHNGMLFLLYLSIYSIGRFLISFVRGDRVIALGLQQAHIISLLVLAVTVPLFVYLAWRKPRALPERAEAPEEEMAP